MLFLLWFHWWLVDYVTVNVLVLSLFDYPVSYGSFHTHVNSQTSGIVGVVTLLLDDIDVGALLMLGWGAACLPVPIFTGMFAPLHLHFPFGSAFTGLGP